MASGMPGFFDFDERLKELSAKGDDLERLKAVADFEMFRPALEEAVRLLSRHAVSRSWGGSADFGR